jgi:hypothetical protein
MTILSGLATMGTWGTDWEGADDLEAVHVAVAVVMAIVGYEVARRPWPFVRGPAGSDA